MTTADHHALADILVAGADETALEAAYRAACSDRDRVAEERDHWQVLAEERLAERDRARDLAARLEAQLARVADVAVTFEKSAEVAGSGQGSTFSACARVLRGVLDPFASAGTDQISANSGDPYPSEGPPANGRQSQRGRRP